MSNLAISLSSFTFDNSPVRTTEINNQLWFLANDVCSILEYKNPRRTIELHCKEKGVTKRYTLTNGGEQEMTYISESNLFRLIIKSKQEKAVIFEEWVMDDLLPTIRKTGSYSLTINTEQKYLIRKAVNERVHRTGEKHQAIYHKFYDYFKINSYEALPASKFDEAIKWLGGAIQVEDNYDVLAKQVARLEIIYDCQQKLHQIYMNKLEDFIEKLSPSNHYNISTLFNKIQVNLGLSLNYATTAHPTRIVTAQKN